MENEQILIDAIMAGDDRELMRLLASCGDDVSTVTIQNPRRPKSDCFTSSVRANGI